MYIHHLSKERQSIRCLASLKYLQNNTFGNVYFNMFNPPICIVPVDAVRSKVMTAGRAVWVLACARISAVKAMLVAVRRVQFSHVIPGEINRNYHFLIFFGGEDLMVISIDVGHWCWDLYFCLFFTWWSFDHCQAQPFFTALVAAAWAALSDQSDHNTKLDQAAGSDQQQQPLFRSLNSDFWWFLVCFFELCKTQLGPFFCKLSRFNHGQRAEFWCFNAMSYAADSYEESFSAGPVGRHWTASKRDCRNNNNNTDIAKHKET